MTRQDRIAVLQHGRRQAATLEELARCAGTDHVVQLAPVPVEESLERSQLLTMKICALRNTGVLRRARFANPDDAIGKFISQVDTLESAVWEFYGGSMVAGLFAGHLDRVVLKRWLASGHDGFSAFERDLSAGQLLDWVVDDDLDGTFAEIESW